MQADSAILFAREETEIATAFSREVLRNWETRFSFPQPARGARDRRVYTS
jgi:DNA-binding transcriptional MerR regulator